MDPWYLIFGALVVAVGLVSHQVRFPRQDIGALLLLVGVALGGVAVLEALMAHVEGWTPELSYQGPQFRGGGPLAHWTAHKQHRERDGCSTSGGFDQCLAEETNDD